MMHRSQQQQRHQQQPRSHYQSHSHAHHAHVPQQRASEESGREKFLRTLREPFSTLSGLHRKPVTSLLELSSDGTLASSSFDGSVHLLQRTATTSEAVGNNPSPSSSSSFSSHSKRKTLLPTSGGLVMAIAEATTMRHGQLLGIASKNTVTVWKYGDEEDRRKQLQQKYHNRGRLLVGTHDRFVRCIAHLHLQQADGDGDGKHFFVSGSEEGCIKVWDFESLLDNDGDDEEESDEDDEEHQGQRHQQSLSCMRILMGHRKPVCCVCSFSNGEFLASGGEDQSVTIWDWQRGSCLLNLKRHLSTVNCLVELLSMPQYLEQQQQQQQQYQRQNYRQQQNAQRSLDVGSTSSSLPTSPPKVLASCSSDGSIRLWEIRRVRKQFNSLTNENFMSVIGISIHRIYVPVGWGVTSITPIRDSSLLSPSSLMLASGSMDGMVRVWNYACECVFALAIPQERFHIGCLTQITRDGSLSMNNAATVLAAGTSNGSIYIWRLLDRNKSLVNMCCYNLAMKLKHNLRDWTEVIPSELLSVCYAFYEQEQKM